MVRAPHRGKATSCGVLPCSRGIVNLFLFLAIGMPSGFHSSLSIVCVLHKFVNILLKILRSVLVEGKKKSSCQSFLVWRLFIMLMPFFYIS